MNYPLQYCAVSITISIFKVNFIYDICHDGMHLLAIVPWREIIASCSLFNIPAHMLVQLNFIYKRKTICRWKIFRRLCREIVKLHLTLYVCPQLNISNISSKIALDFSHKIYSLWNPTHISSDILLSHPSETCWRTCIAKVMIIISCLSSQVFFLF